MAPLKQKLANLPTEPGVYLMKDAKGEIIYVGKAGSLRDRVGSYFQSSSELQPRISRMIEQVVDFDFIVTRSEIEALALEFTLIQQHRPRYNVRFRDDKRYPYIRIPVNEPYPPLMVVRRPAQDGARYFGPHSSTRSMWQTLRLLRKIFRLRFARKDSRRTCSGRAWDPAGPKLLRPCLDYHLGLCLAPCIAGATTPVEYAAAVKDAIEFLEGRTEALLKHLRAEMDEASQELRYEAAAKLRDSISSVEWATAQQRVVGEKREEMDAIAAALEQDLACITVFKIREGRLTGETHFFLEGITGLEAAEVITEFVKGHYQRVGAVPALVLVANEIAEKEVVQTLLQQLRGKRVELLAPKRGKKKALLALAAENAQHYLKEMLAREGAVGKRAEAAIKELQMVLKLDEPPYRIEGYDISNLFGYQAVGSMVVFENGQAKKSDYRRFKIRLKEGRPDDFAMMREVLWRRLQAGLKGSAKFEQMPDLILVDGGKGQLNVAREVLRELDLEIPAAGLAKEFEHLFVEGKSDPILLPRHSRSLHLLQAMRDEAHRFAINYHRALKRKAAVNSLLLAIPGIGKKRQQALLARFKSLEEIRQAGVEELTAVPGMTRSAAEALLTNLRVQNTLEVSKLEP